MRQQPCFSANEFSKVWQCYDGLPAQKLWITGDNHIAVEGDNQCADVKDNAGPLQSWQCIGENTNQASFTLSRATTRNLSFATTDVPFLICLPQEFLRRHANWHREPDYNSPQWTMDNTHFPFIIYSFIPGKASIVKHVSRLVNSLITFLLSSFIKILLPFATSP